MLAGDGLGYRARRAPGDPDEQRRRPFHRVALQVRRDDAFEAVRGIGVHSAAPCLQRDAARLEPRAFEKDVPGFGGDSTFLSSHDTCERHRSRLVRDHERVGVELDGRAVEEGQ